MAKRWVRLLGSLVVAVLVGLGVRSLVLPARSACVFLEYEEGEAWERAPENPLFEGGSLAFAGPSRSSSAVKTWAHGTRS